MLQRIFLAGLVSCALFYRFAAACLEGAVFAAATAACMIEQAELPAIGEAAIPARLAAAVGATPSDPDERAVLEFLRSRHTGMSRFDEENVARAVVREARRHGLDPALVLAVIQVESGGYYLAVSHVGALGLMQLLPATAEELAGKLGVDWRGPDSLFDPVVNVQLGTAYIKHLADRYGDVSTALAAYNWGPTRIDRRIRKGSGIPSIYSERVMRAFDVALSRRQLQPTRS